ncbi:MAG: sugar O-acyltransferase [Pseudomonadota bacterium]
MAQSLCVLGAGGNLLDVLDTLDAINADRMMWNLRGVFDDRLRPGTLHHGLAVLGPLCSARERHNGAFVSSIWNEKTFVDLPSILAGCGIEEERFATLIHPAAGVSRRARVGYDVLIHFGASVAGQVLVGNHVSIGPRAVIGHDTRLRGYDCVAAGATLSGAVDVGECCYIGSASSVRQQLKIGTGCLVGMGAVVVDDVPPHTTVVGNPARPLERPFAHSRNAHHAAVACTTHR